MIQSNPHSPLSLALRKLYTEPRSQHAAPNYASIHVPNLSPACALAEDAFRDQRQGVTGARDVDGGTIFMANHAARPNRLRVDYRQQIVNALDTVDGSRDLDGAIARQVVRHHSSQRGAATVRLDGQPLDADAATLQRSRDADGEWGLFRLPG